MQTKTLQKLARLLDKRLPKCFVSDLIRKVPKSQSMYHPEPAHKDIKISIQ